MEIDPTNDGAYVVLSNIYADAGVLCMLEDIEGRLLMKQEPSDTTSQHSERLAIASGPINNQENCHSCLQKDLEWK
ncbi:hypothetical protein NC651_038215 [Populus alba x Populus x berolinensis]|nr:hypothetical protein NC651_038215 [Populus alba x Populus x berolinensis]